MRKISVVLFIACLIYSCKTEPEITTYHENGGLSERYSITQDSIKNGLYTSFRPGGEKLETANYINGLLDGERTIFYENGNAEIKEHYKTDKLHGEYKTYYPSGKMELVMQYVNGVISGNSVKYFESGKLMEEVNFENNEENGPFVEYHESGNKKWEGVYLNGENEVGLLLNYNKEGVLIKKMMCDSSSICQTVWTLEQGDITPIQLFEGE